MNTFSRATHLVRSTDILLDARNAANVWSSLRGDHHLRAGDRKQSL